jgi:hypothetical protein
MAALRYVFATMRTLFIAAARAAQAKLTPPTSTLNLVSGLEHIPSHLGDEQKSASERHQYVPLQHL